MNVLRSVLFNIFFIFGSLFWSIALLWILILPQKTINAIVRNVYFKYIHLITRYIMGIRLEVKGAENLPKNTPFILASKHQSAYETLILPILVPDIAIILKRELTWLPIWGWYPACMGMIPIDRGSGIQAMKSIITGAKKTAENGRPILIFPQGTRTKPGEAADYKPGLTKIYKELNLPIIPLALNSGVCWPKNSLIKKSGTITFEFLPAIPAGLPPKEAIEQSKASIEKHSDALLS